MKNFKVFIFLNRTTRKMAIIKATKFEMAEQLLLSQDKRGFELFNIMGDGQLMATITLPGILTDPIEELQEKSPTRTREANV